MLIPEISDIENNKIKTICEFLFFDQYQETASFNRFEKCFQPLFNNIDNISFKQIFKDISGHKKKYITNKRFLKAYLTFKNNKNALSKDTKIFFDKLLNSILKSENDFVGNNIKNNIIYSTSRTCKCRNSITNIQVLVDIKGKIHGINVEYDGTYKVEIYPKTLEENLRLILDMKLGVLDNNFFKQNIKRYKSTISDLYRDSITHIFGTLDKNGFISFIGFKSISGKTLFTGFPEGNGFLFGEFGKKIHDFTIQFNEQGINKLQPGFKTNLRTNYFLNKNKNFSIEELNKDEIIKDEMNLIGLTDENEIDKLITTPMIEDNHFFNNNLKDEYNGNDYKEVVDQYPRKWLDNGKINKYLIINSVNDAIDKYNEETEKTFSRTTVISNNQINDYKYNQNQNPFFPKEKPKKFIKNPFFPKYCYYTSIDELDELNQDSPKALHKTRIYKNPLTVNDENDINQKKINRTEIICVRKNNIEDRIRDMTKFLNKRKYNKLIKTLAKDIRKDLKNDKNQTKRKLLNQLFPFSDNKNEENVSLNKNNLDNSGKNTNEGNKKIIPKKEENNKTNSNTIIFKTNIEKANFKNGDFFSFQKLKKFINKNSGDKTVIKKWRDFKKGIEKYHGKYLFKNIGAVIKAMKILEKKDISFLEKVHLHTILKKNENIFNFLTKNKNIKEEEEEEEIEYQQILIPDEHPERITSLTELQKNLEKLKEFKKQDLPKETREKIDLLYNLYLKQKNILIENETLKYKTQLIENNSIDYEKYLNEEKEKKDKAKEEENKKICEAELKKEKKEKENANKLLKESFYDHKFKTKKTFLNQKLPEASNIWEDDKFIPNKTNLCPIDEKGKWILNKGEDQRESDVENWDKIQWCKAEQLNEMSNYKIILNEPLIENILQSYNLFDCYFISAVGSLCKLKSYISKLFHIKGRSKENAYGIYLFLNGEWKLVLLDDYIPCMTNNFDKMLCFGYSLFKELWVSLIEKAWAKVNGSYIKIGSGGECNEVFDVLTEAYTEQIYIDNPDYDEIAIWEKLEKAINHKYMVCIGSNDDDNLQSVGLIGSHEYTLIDIFTEETTKGKERVVKLRNPYGEIEYSERWSDFDDIWTDELKKKYNLKQNENDGIFHMPFEEMLNDFCVIEIARIEPNYQTKICKIKKKENIQCQVIKLKIENKTTNFYINLYQKNPRIINKNGEYPLKPVLSFIILAKLDGDNLKYIDSATSISENVINKYNMHIMINTDLEPGTYYIFSDVNYRYIYRKNYGYTITTYSEYPVKSLKNITKSVNASELLTKVMYDYCIEQVEESENSSEELDIYQTDNSDFKLPFNSLCFNNKSNSSIKIEVKIIKEEDDNNYCFYCDKKAREQDESVIKEIRPNSFESFITMPYYSLYNYKLEYNLI